MRDAVAQVLAHYPRIFLACHVRHRRDPKTRRLLSAHQGSILDHLDDLDRRFRDCSVETAGVTSPLAERWWRSRIPLGNRQRLYLFGIADGPG